MNIKYKDRPRLPHWMKMKKAEGTNYSRVKNIVSKNSLHTICSSGNCPNIGECWGRGTATFMILGDICTRSCKFCGVKTGRPKVIDINEPKRIAESVMVMDLAHCVITSVDRDDLEDGGASIWTETIIKTKELNQQTSIEVLIPDFQGNKENIQSIIDAKPDVISHNLETVERLTPQIRSGAKYHRSLSVIEEIAKSGIPAKSGIMLGLGEKEEEILATMDDLRNANCKIMTIGQYLQPSIDHLQIVEYIKPEKFDRYKEIGLAKGFSFVESSPLVRSSYQAEKHVLANNE